MAGWLPSDQGDFLKPRHFFDPDFFFRCGRPVRKFTAEHKSYGSSSTGASGGFSFVMLLESALEIHRDSCV
jgi:hypothetical protein